MTDPYAHLDGRDHSLAIFTAELDRYAAERGDHRPDDSEADE